MQAKPSSYLPLTEPTFYILLSLALGKKHGYAILKDVEALSDGKVRLSTSTLYGALGRLLDQGLIERVPNDEGENTGPGPGLPRKAYILSETGRRVLEAETGRLQSLVAVAHLRLGEEHT
jgi:DNA-binding PadR family transcriptional regulator